MAEDRRAAAYAAIPKVIYALGHARDAAAPYEHAFWAAHRDLEDACARKAELTKDQLFAFYDRRMEAGHAWHPFRQAVRGAEELAGGNPKEVKECDAILRRIIHPAKEGQQP